MSPLPLHSCLISEHWSGRCSVDILSSRDLIPHRSLTAVYKLTLPNEMFLSTLVSNGPRLTSAWTHRRKLRLSLPKTDSDLPSPATRVPSCPVPARTPPATQFLQPKSQESLLPPSLLCSASKALENLAFAPKPFLDWLLSPCPLPSLPDRPLSPLGRTISRLGVGLPAIGPATRQVPKRGQGALSQTRPSVMANSVSTHLG